MVITMTSVIPYSCYCFRYYYSLNTMYFCQIYTTFLGHTCIAIEDNHFHSGGCGQKCPNSIECFILPSLKEIDDKNVRINVSQDPQDI